MPPKRSASRTKSEDGVAHQPSRERSKTGGGGERTPRGNSQTARKSASLSALQAAQPFISDRKGADVPVDSDDSVFFSGSEKQEASPWPKLAALLSVELLFLVWLKWAIDVYAAVQPLP